MTGLTHQLRGLKAPTTPTIFEALVDSVIEQQISLKAAHSIENRLIRTVGNPVTLDGETWYCYLTPHILAKTPDSTFRSCGLTLLNGRIRIGTGDPVATGMLYGGYWATRFVLGASRIVVEMIPDFDRKILEMDIAIRLRVNHPLRILIAGIRLSRNPDIRQGMTFLKPDSTGVTKS